MVSYCTAVDGNKNPVIQHLCEKANISMDRFDHEFHSFMYRIFGMFAHAFQFTYAQLRAERTSSKDSSDAEGGTSDERSAQKIQVISIIFPSIVPGEPVCVTVGPTT